ncbi:hypothetical protein NOVO_03020 [Rickettsiales bacterium Ac37b]|nr:hypothetical protein NOVO_03020 [Rickettsiales bacterium Ac37b]
MRSFDKRYNKAENKPSFKEQNKYGGIEHYNSINICQHLKKYRDHSPDREFYNILRRANQLLDSNEQPKDTILFNARGLSNLLYEISNIYKRNRGIKPELFKILLEEGLLNNWHISACEQLYEFNSQNLANSLYAFLLMDRNTLRIPNELIQGINNNLMNNENSTYHQLYTIYYQLSDKQKIYYLRKRKTL